MGLGRRSKKIHKCLKWRVFLDFLRSFLLKFYYFFVCLQNPLLPKIYGWSMLEMLDSDGGLNVGKFKLPLYGKEYNPYVIYQTGIPYKSEFTFICVEIAAAYEPS